MFELAFQQKQVNIILLQEFPRVSPAVTGPMKIGDVVLDPHTGRLFDTFIQKHLIMLDENFYRGLHDKLYEVFQSGADVILYNIGIGYGEVVAKMMAEMGGSKLALYKKFMEIGRHEGYGTFEVPKLEAIASIFTGDVTVRLKNSFFALAMGKTGKAECQIISGMIAGAAHYTLGEDKRFNCVEVKCHSKGDDYCEFHLKERT